MKNIDSPSSLIQALTTLFPAFANEQSWEEPESYHQVVIRLSSHITTYLQAASAQTIKDFCDLINTLVLAGGDKKNAISTCLLEHASQIKLSPIIRLHLNAAAKWELR